MENSWNQGQLLSLSGSYWKAFTLHTGVELEIFTRLGQDMVEAEELASLLGLNERGLKALLNALTAMGLLIHVQRAYGNTPESKELLIKGAPKYIGDMILHHKDLVPSWHSLGEAVRTGGPVRIHGENDSGRGHFLKGMFVSAMGIAPGLAKELDLSGRRRLLDLGGGPGTFAIHFCLNNPELHGTVFDLPATGSLAMETIERFGVAERVSFQPGDYHEDEIEGTYDVIWLSHILHAEGPEGCRTILKKAISSLEPGGLIFIHEFILEETMDGPLFPALFYLNMLVNTQAAGHIPSRSLEACWPGKVLVILNGWILRATASRELLSGPGRYFAAIFKPLYP